MKCLVTGGAGFVGSHLVDKLIKEGHKVLVVDNLSTGRKENLNPKAKFYKIDIRDPQISRIFKTEKPEVVFHCAAQTEVQKSIENPKENADTNVSGALNILENAKRFGTKKIIFFSSVGIYGESFSVPIKENYPLHPLSPYAITKLVVEKYLFYYQSLGLNFVSLRYANIYGPRQLNSAEGGVVPIFINAILNKKNPIIYGDGEQTRDFLFVEDAVDSAVLCLRAQPGSIYNVGTSKETTINELLILISQKIKSTIKPHRARVRLGEVRKSCLDFSKIKKELNWQPKNNLVEGLEKTIDWFKKYYV